MDAYIESGGKLSFFERALLRESAARLPALYAFKYHGLLICNQRPNESFERE
jgi:hypothetical protein